MFCKSFLIILAAITLLPATQGAPAQESRFTETLEVTRSEWYRGEAVQFRFTRCNATGSVLHVQCRPCFQASASHVIIRTDQGMEVARTQPAGCGAVCIPDTWAVGECRSSTSTWPQVSGQFPYPGDGDLVEPGTYYAETMFGDPPLRTGTFQIHGSAPPIPTLGATSMAIFVLLLMFGSWRYWAGVYSGPNPSK